MNIKYCITGLFLLWTAASFGQRHAVDISSLSGYDAINRSVFIRGLDEQKPVVFLDAKQGQGMAWLKDVNFSYGIIEFDVKGKNLAQESFVGLAYHGINDSTFDAIYFRPFNFLSTNKESKNHCVQYISMPKYDWFNLRHLFKGEFENGLNVQADPDGWIHAKIEISEKQVRVFVNGNVAPSLVVKPLNKTSHGRIGFWVGNGSDGSFANLIIDEKAMAR